MRSASLLLAGTFGNGTVDFLFDGEVLREDVAFEQTEPNVLMAWSARGAARTYNPAVEGLVDLIRRHSTVRVRTVIDINLPTSSG